MTLEAPGWFLVGAAIGALGVWVINLSNRPQSPLWNYFKSIPPIDTSIPLKGG